MPDAGLNLRGHDVGQTTILRCVEHLEPESCAFGLLDSRARRFLAVVGANREAGYTTLFLIRPASRIVSRTAPKPTTRYIASSRPSCHCSTSASMSSLTVAIASRVLSPSVNSLDAATGRGVSIPIDSVVRREPERPLVLR